MPRGEYLGEFEQMALLAMARMGNTAYGMTIRDEIEARTGRSVSIGSVYAVLDRMERAGFVRSSLGEPTKQRGGRAKRFYRLEGAGATALTGARQALSSLWEGLEIDQESFGS